MPRPRAVLAAAAVVAGLLALPSAAAAPAGLSFLRVLPAAQPTELAQVVDAPGRRVLLRGVNINGLEDYYQANATPLAVPYPGDPGAYAHGRCPGPNPAVETMALCEFDAAEIRSFGYDSVRLALSWSLLEPRPGRISRAYLDRVSQVVGWFRAQGVRVILDLHQDAWSKYVYTPPSASCPFGFSTVGGYHEADGAPDWATSRQLPVCALGGVRELDAAVQANFENFYLDAAGPDGVGLQEHYAAVLAALAVRFRSDPTVAGYDLMNEPSPGFTPAVSSATLLLRLDAKLVAAMRAAAPGFRQLVVVEPEVTRDVTDQGAAVLPWSAFSDYPNVVYGPHLYPGVFTPDSTVADAAGTPRFVPVHTSYLQAARDARLLGLPLWVGEFGTGVADDATYLTQHYAEQDAVAIGSSLWVWKEFARSHFSVEHEPFGRGVPYPSRVAVTDRLYPQAVNGRVAALSYDPSTGAGALTVDGALVGGPPTLVHLPRRITGTVTITGADGSFLAEPGGGRTMMLRPRGATYAVTVTGS